MTTFEQEFIEKKIDIKIPLLQRDYVQGGREDVIKPFMEQLKSVIEKETETEKMDLNYIYGYNEESTAFIPIDGQQRLITLWLLHLYIYAKTSKEYPVNLIFESREFADSFCEKLKGKLCDILKEKDTEDDLKEKIIDAEWFVNGWLSDVTVVNMLNTLNLIGKETLPDNPKLENIVFEFLNMKDENIDDDVYIKMNGRGRPLSYFENLKSWMDEQVKKEEDFGKEWENKMDNEWTDFFWKNRNKTQEHPEEIDDEQVRLFYSLLLLYWKKNDTKEKDNELFSSLQSGKMISLYQIEKSKLFNSEVFHFISNSLDVLSDISENVNNNIQNVIGVLDLDKLETTILYKLVLKDATYSSSLPLLYAMIKTPELYRSSSLFRWMRIWINLVHNSDIRQENLGRFCETVDKIYKEIEKEKSSDSDVLYSVLSKFSWSEGMGIAKDQFYEEIAKAKQILQGKECDKPKDDKRSWEEIIIDAEKYAFFKGAIRFLFQNKNGEPCWDDFDKKWENAKKYFGPDGVKDGVESNCMYKTNSLLMKCLLANCDDFQEKVFYHFEFSNDALIWRRILLSDKWRNSVDVVLKSDNFTTEETVKNIKDEDIKNIVDDGLMDFICNVRSGACIRKTYHNYYALWQNRYPSYQVVINPILSQLAGKEIEYNEENKIPNCRFYKCRKKNVEFKYKKDDKDYYFQWYGNPNEKELDVYLMDNDWADYKKRQEPVNDEQTDRRDFYCFSVTPEMNNDTSLFIDELDKLIEQVKE